MLKERISNPVCKDEVLVRFEGTVLRDSTSDAQTVADLLERSRRLSGRTDRIHKPFGKDLEFLNTNRV